MTDNVVIHFKAKKDLYFRFKDDGFRYSDAEDYDTPPDSDNYTFIAKGTMVAANNPFNPFFDSDVSVFRDLIAEVQISEDTGLIALVGCLSGLFAIVINTTLMQPATSAPDVKAGDGGRDDRYMPRCISLD